MATGQTTIRLVLDDRGYLRSVDRADQALGKFGRSGGKSTFAVASGFAAAGASAFILVTAIRSAIRATTELAAATVRLGFQAVREYESTQLALQATIASQLQLSDDIKENFQLAGDAARQITDRLIELDRKSAATFNELLQGFQVFAAQGGLGLVRNLEEALQATNLLVNSSKILSKQSNEQLAITTNMRAVLSGQSFQMSEVLQQVASTGAEWKQQLGTIEQQRNLLDVLRGKLSGVDQAADKFGESWDGILSSAETLRDLFLRDVFTKGLDAAKTEALALLDSIDRNKTSISAFLALLAVTGKTAVDTTANLAKAGTSVATALGLPSIIIRRLIVDLSALNTLLIFTQKLAEDPIKTLGNFEITIREANSEATQALADIIESTTKAAGSFDDLLNVDLSDLTRQLEEAAGASDKNAEAIAKFVQQARATIRPADELLEKVEALTAANFNQREQWLVLGPSILQAEKAYQQLGLALDPLLVKMIRLNQEAAKGPFVEVIRARESIPSQEDFFGGIDARVAADREGQLGGFDPRGFGGESIEPGVDSGVGAPGEEIAQQMEATRIRIEEESLRMANAFQTVGSLGVDMFTQLAQGFRQGGPAAAAALLRAVGLVLSKIGFHLVSQGAAEIALGSAPPPFGPRPDLIAHGAKLKALGAGFAVAGTVAGVAGGVVGAAAGGPPGSPGNPINVVQAPGTFQQQNVISPVSQVQAAQAQANNSTLDRLAVQIERLTGIPAGQVVIQGIDQSGGIRSLQTGLDIEDSTQRTFGESSFRGFPR